MGLDIVCEYLSSYERKLLALLSPAACDNVCKYGLMTLRTENLEICLKTNEDFARKKEQSNCTISNLYCSKIMNDNEFDWKVPEYDMNLDCYLVKNHIGNLRRYLECGSNMQQKSQK